MNKEQLQNCISKLDNCIKNNESISEKEELETILLFLCELRDRRNGVITYIE